MIKNALILLTVLALSGCTNMGLITSASEPDEDNHRIGCYSGEFTGTYTASEASGGVFIVPKIIDINEWTAEDIANMAKALGCQR